MRDIIASNIPIYKKAKTKGEKGKIIIEMTKKLILASPSKTGFVKLDPKTGRWYFIGYEKSKDKVGHAIRKATQFQTKKEQKRMELLDNNRGNVGEEEGGGGQEEDNEKEIPTTPFPKRRPTTISEVGQHHDLRQSPTYRFMVGNKSDEQHSGILDDQDQQYHHNLQQQQPQQQQQQQQQQPFESPVRDNIFSLSPRRIHTGVTNNLQSPLHSDSNLYPTSSSLPVRSPVDTNIDPTTTAATTSSSLTYQQQHGGNFHPHGQDQHQQAAPMTAPGGPVVAGNNNPTLPPHHYPQYYHYYPPPTQMPPLPHASYMPVPPQPPPPSQVPYHPSAQMYPPYPYFYPTVNPSHMSPPLQPPAEGGGVSSLDGT